MKLNEQREIQPLGAYVFVKPLKFNPYINKISDSGIITSTGMSLALSQETGQLEKEEQRILYGIVVAVGDGCKYFQVGDEMIFDKNVARPVPVLDMGLYSVGEPQAIGRIFGEGDAFEAALQAEMKLEEEIKAKAFERQMLEGITPQTIKIN